MLRFLLQFNNAIIYVLLAAAVVKLVTRDDTDAAVIFAVLFNVRMLRRSSFTRRVLTGNRMLWISIAVLAVLQLGYTYLPPFQDWFGSVPLNPAQWAMSLGYALVCFLAIEAMKAIGWRLRGHRAV